jgi:hypothetical protein
MGASVRFRNWILVYLATGPTFARWAILAFYGGAVVLVGFLLLIGIVVVGAR